MLSFARDDCRELWNATRALREGPANFDLIFASCPSALHDSEAAEHQAQAVSSLSRSDLHAAEPAVNKAKDILVLDPGPGPLHAILKGATASGAQVHVATATRSDLPACLSLDQLRRRLRLFQCKCNTPDRFILLLVITAGQAKHQT